MMTLLTFLAILLNAFAAGLNFALALDNYKNNRLGWLPINLSFGIAGLAMILVLVI